MKIEQLKERFQNVSQTTSGYKSDCPICDKGNGKQHLSLTIRKTKEGKNYTSLKCWKGNCDGKDITQAIGLGIADIYDNPEKENKTKPVIVATYDYFDETGNYLHRKIRKQPKSFHQEKWDAESQQWVKGLEGINTVPYNLPFLITNNEAKEIVFVVEGEKDADNILNKLNLLSSTNTEGANVKWKESYSQYFKDFPVVIISDKDKVGREHGQDVASKLYEIASSVKVIEMPEIEGKTIKDASDYIEAGGTKEDFLKLANDAPIWTPQVIALTALDTSNCINDAVDIPNFPNPPKVQNTEKELEPIEAYYDAPKKEYLVKNSRGVWLSHNIGQFKSYLKSKGYNGKSYDGEISEIDKFIININDKNDIYYAGRIAGYRAGFYEDKRILVTESPIVIEPEAGEWNTLKGFIDGLFYEDGFNQQLFLYSWLKIGYEALRAGHRRQGQALVICGEPDCGKSFLQSFITKILGGKSAKPYQYMMGETQFNSDLFGAVHLMLEDEITSTDIRTRLYFGSRIKDITANPSQRLHSKGRDAINDINPLWRLSITLNDETENLMILPPLEKQMIDKLIILRAHKTPMSMPTNSLTERKAFEDKLTSELPAFLDYLIKLEIPKELISERYGITHFHHPVLVSEINNLAPQARLLEMIDMAIIDKWEGTAKDLEVLLKGNQTTREDANKLLSWFNSCGTYLARLEKDNPQRIIRNRHKGNTSQKWTINPLSKYSGDDDDNRGGVMGLGISNIGDNGQGGETSSETTAITATGMYGVMGLDISTILGKNNNQYTHIVGQRDGLEGVVAGSTCGTHEIHYPITPKDDDLWGDV